MQTILQILERTGGYRPTLSFKIENPPYMPLVIEAIEPGPLGLPGLSVAHYGEQNGDLMRDPEMCFELSQPIRSKLSLDPYDWETTTWPSSNGPATSSRGITWPCSSCSS
jgi:hypothetical protein